MRDKTDTVIYSDFIEYPQQKKLAKNYSIIKNYFTKKKCIYRKWVEDKWICNLKNIKYGSIECTNYDYNECLIDKTGAKK